MYQDLGLLFFLWTFKSLYMYIYDDIKIWEVGFRIGERKLQVGQVDNLLIVSSLHSENELSRQKLCTCRKRRKMIPKLSLNS